VGLYGLILPSFEQTLVERKRELIRELTNSAWSVLAAYEQDVQEGILTRPEAEAAAASVIGRLRYGDERLDYFWIQDTGPTMVMHPYRTDLEGQDLSGFTDPRGVAIFEEFAELVEDQEQGYVDYVWQWFDDSERLEPKESYVKGFEPWGWVIGTGLYVDDVRAEIEGLERDLVLASVGISGAIAILLLFVLQQSLRIERRREDAVLRLRDSRARYRALAEATTEGTLLVVDGRCRYANPTFMAMLGYSPRQMELLELADVLPHSDGNKTVWQEFGTSEPDAGDESFGTATDAVLRRADGSALECVVSLTPVLFGGQSGHVLLARDVAASAAEAADAHRPGLPPGAFRARASRRGVFLDIGPATRQLVERLGHAEEEQPALADCFADAAEFGRVFGRLLDEGELRDYRLSGTPGGSDAVLLSAVVNRDEQGEPEFVDGYLMDISGIQAEDAGVSLERMESSPGFLHESVASISSEALMVALETPVAEVARRMTERGVTAALVGSDREEPIGIVTDVDLRTRVLAEERPPGVAIQALMSAPLVRIDGDAPAYAALLRMEERSVHHLVVDDVAGLPPRILDRAVLGRWTHHAPMALLRTISESRSVRDIARGVQRSVPMAEALMDSGTRVEHVTRLLTSVYDAATVCLLEMAIEESGPPPAAFAYVVMGSQGRGEVTLRSDQDSGIVYDAETGPAAPLAAEYFRALGRTLRDGLAAAGYSACPGGVMASEPAWCRSTTDWQETLDGWLRRPEPSQVTDLSVFLDLRRVYGSSQLAAALRQPLAARLPDEQGLLYQLARGALAFKPPMRLPGNIFLGGGADRGEIDLKDALQSLVAFARLFAVRYGATATHTLERVDVLGERQVISASTRDELRDSYRFLMDLRIRSQLDDVRAGRSPSSRVALSSLNHLEQESMRQAFGRIAAAQRQVDSDFPELG
jgi:PAS domain S-box-containing protein